MRDGRRTNPHHPTKDHHAERTDEDKGQGLAVVGAILVAGAWLWGAAALAAPIADAEYVGVTSDLAVFKLGIVEGSEGVTTIEIGPASSAFTYSCYASGTINPTGLAFTRAGLQRAAGDEEIFDPATGETRFLRISGNEYRAGVVTGSLSISGVANDEGVTCAPRSFTWAAVARTTDEAPRLGVAFKATVFAGETFGGLRASGTASFSTTAEGAVTGFMVAPTEACAATNLSSLSTPLEAGSASLFEARDATTETAYARYRLAITGGNAVGVFAIDRDRVGCRPLTGVLVAQEAMATPTPTATATATSTGTATPTPIVTPTPTGRFAAPPVFPPSGPRLAQVVFLGGTITQLDTALTSNNANGAWAQTSTGVFYLYIVGAPAFVNAPFLQAFPNGFASTTALTIVGR